MQMWAPCGSYSVKLSQMVALNGVYSFWGFLPNHWVLPACFQRQHRSSRCHAHGPSLSKARASASALFFTVISTNHYLHWFPPSNGNKWRGIWMLQQWFFLISAGSSLWHLTKWKQIWNISQNTFNILQRTLLPISEATWGLLYAAAVAPARRGEKHYTVHRDGAGTARRVCICCSLLVM